MSTNEKSVFGQIKYISEIALNFNSKGYTILDDILFSNKFIRKKMEIQAVPALLL